MTNYGALGYPVKNGLPLIYSKLFASAGVNAGFSTFPIKEDVELPILMHFLERFNFAGLNIDAPHKRAIVSHIQSVDDSAKEIGAVNCLKYTKDGWVGYNTECEAFRRFITLNNIDVVNKSVLIFGSGSGAISSSKVLFDLGVKKIVCINRSVANGERFVDHFYGKNIQNTQFKQLKEETLFDIVLNCTPIEWGNKIWLDHFWYKHLGESKPFGGCIPPLAIDLQWADVGGSTPFLDLWKNLNSEILCYSGNTLFEEQAKLSFDIWMGKNSLA